MSYNTDVNGSLTIEPPLTWAEIKDSPFYRPKGVSAFDFERTVNLLVEETEQETDEGTLTVRFARELIPVMEDPFGAHDLEAHVREFVRLHGFHHVIDGRFTCLGEDNDDVWRLEVHSGDVAKIRSVVLWPEDLTELRHAADDLQNALALADRADEVNPNPQRLLHAVRTFLKGQDYLFRNQSH